MKKKAAPPIMVHLVRIEATTEKKKRGKNEYDKVPFRVTDVFILAESVSQAEQMVDEDTYGLIERGFQPTHYYKLTVAGGSGWASKEGDVMQVRFPKTGAYETCSEVYKGDK